MAYDDIRNSRSNPFYGKMFNQPDGVDVAEGLKIDYTGRDNTPENFIAVLTGDSKTTGGKPVLESDSNSKVFVYFADHGAPGLIAFPSSYLYADTLGSAIETMTEKKMFDQLVFYIEACESGSMFPNLASNTGVYAMTAANATESSWGYYCYPDDTINGTHVNSCLGDTFSIRWMEDSDSHYVNSESLDTQHTHVKAQTDKSHVQQFGDLSYQQEPIGDFQGIDDQESVTFFNKMFNKVSKKVQSKKTDSNPREVSSVSSRDATLHYLYNRVMSESSEESHNDLAEHLDMRVRTDKIFQTIFEDVNVEEAIQPTKFDCLRFLMNSYETHCESFNDYSLKHVRYLSNHCETAQPEHIFEAARAFASICQ